MAVIKWFIVLLQQRAVGGGLAQDRNEDILRVAAPTEESTGVPLCPSVARLRGGRWRSLRRQRGRLEAWREKPWYGEKGYNECWRKQLNGVYDVWTRLAPGGPDPERVCLILPGVSLVGLFLHLHHARGGA